MNMSITFIHTTCTHYIHTHNTHTHTHTHTVTLIIHTTCTHIHAHIHTHTHTHTQYTLQTPRSQHSPIPDLHNQIRIGQEARLICQIIKRDHFLHELVQCDSVRVRQATTQRQRHNTQVADFRLQEADRASDGAIDRVRGLWEGCSPAGLAVILPLSFTDRLKPGPTTKRQPSDCVPFNGNMKFTAKVMSG